MAQAFYRKYRSKSLNEVVGQEHITTALHNALKSGKISHAYLFTGPRGVGKTSIARILAHEVNGLPYTDESSHLDIIEIDAASNRRIDEIRDLRDKVNVAPTSARYKVYIIDEVHMLTREAFNALLKTLEEPPAHVIFILATTESHKLPETIVSRTQRFTFKPISTESAIAHLKQIALSEKVTISDEALELIAEHGKGSFRDSISLLDQVSAMTTQVDAETVLSILGAVPSHVVQQLADLVDQAARKEIIEILQEVRQSGVQPATLAIQLSDELRSRMIGRDQVTKEDLELLEKLLSVPASAFPASSLELALMSRSAAPSAAQPTPVPNTIPPEQKKPAPSTKTHPVSIPQPASTAPKAPLEVAVSAQPSTTTQNDLETAWPLILADLKKHHSTLYGITRMAQPSLNGSQLTLAFAFAFHQKQLTDTQKRQKLASIMAPHLGEGISISCVIQESRDSLPATENVTSQPPHEPETLQHTAAAPTHDPSLEAITGIFGGAEVLEA